jgi:hypothetical protein
MLGPPEQCPATIREEQGAGRETRPETHPVTAVAGLTAEPEEAVEPEVRAVEAAREAAAESSVMVYEGPCASGGPAFSTEASGQALDLRQFAIRRHLDREALAVADGAEFQSLASAQLGPDVLEPEIDNDSACRVAGNRGLRRR